jgi:hypothetical protein
MDSKKFKFCYHEIPFSNFEEAKKKPFTLVGIIDASGSMGKLWKLLIAQWNALTQEYGKEAIHTITFDTKVRYNANDPTLKTLLNKHGGGGTTLDEPFLKFQEIWREKIPTDHEIKVIFISDGQDNEVATLKTRLSKLKRVNSHQSVTFMCLGIQSEFPTVVAMQLRDIYHTGDPNCPSVFLIEYASEKALFNKFQALKIYLRRLKMVKIDPSQILYPWESCVDEMPEGTKFCSEDERIYLPEEKKVLEYESRKITSYNISDLFRNWTLRLQLEVLNKKVEPKLAEEYAISAYNLMKEIIDDYKLMTGIDLLNENETRDGVSFVQRVQANQSRYERLKIIGYMATMQKISSGQMVAIEDEYETAKQLGIGTIIGKHKQKIFALKALNTENYQRIIEEFLTVHRKLLLSEPADQDRSFYIMESQREIFMDKTFQEGIQLIQDPYTMVECLPMVGLCLEVKRVSGASLDPWKIAVKSIPVIHRIGDTSMIVRQSLQTVLSTGEGKPSEKINCIIPLFSKDDIDMTSLINTKMYQHMVSYFVTEVMDVIHPEAYVALLSNLFVYIVSSKDNSANQALLEKIYWTMDILYRDDTGYMKSWINTLVYSQELALSPYNEKTNPQGYKGLAQVYSGLFFMKRKKMIEEEEIEELIQRVMIEYLSERLKEAKLSNFISFGQVESYLSVLLKEYENTKVLRKFYTLKRLKKHTASKEFAKEITNLDLKKTQTKISPNDLVVNTNFLLQDKRDIICYETLGLLQKFFGQKDFNKFQLISLLVHVSKHQTPVLRQRELVSFDSELNTAHVVSEVGSITETNIVNQLKSKASDILSQSFLDLFKKTHFEIVPMSKQAIQDECKKRSLPFGALQYDEKTGLCKNACMAPNCPHFLNVVAGSSIRNHMSGWQGTLPKGFHSLVRSKKHQPLETIYQEFLKGEGVADPSKFGVDKEQVCNYIEKLRHSYSSF